MDFPTLGLRNLGLNSSWLKSLGLESSGLESSWLKGLGLKLGVEKSRGEMALNCENNLANPVRKEPNVTKSSLCHSV